MIRRWIVRGIVVAGLFAAACGGGDGDEDDNGVPSGGDDPEPTATQEDVSSDDEGASDAGGEPGDVTITTDPGQGVIEVDGETIVVTWDEARFKSCEITESNIQIEFTIDDGRRLAIRGGPMPQWSAIAYVSAADSGEFQYELRFPQNANLGIGDMALSMEGGAVYMEGFAAVDDELRDATIAVNCEGTEG